MKTIFKALIITTFLPGYFINESSAMIDLNRYAKNIYKPVAVVDEAIISEDDVQQTINIMRMSGVDITRDDAIDKAINETVILCAGHKEISQSFVDSTISNLATENGLSDDDFNKMLTKFGVEMGYFRKQIEAQIILNEMIRDKVQSDQNQAIKDLYKSAKAVKQQIIQNDQALTRASMHWQFNNNSQVKIAEILVSQKNQQNFDTIVNLLQSNTEFKIIKKQFPSDVSLTDGDGAIGWVDYNDLSETYKQVIKKSSIGHFTEPLAMEDKILFIKVIDIKNATQSQSGDNKEYLKLSYDRKSEMLLNNVKAKFYSETAINQLKKETFIQVF
jgi:hypothetical protein